ncbi:MAG: hypothetical protein LBV45_04735 [Xanthomonadaceae bacterium]|nr:hypothetical protein [Xanthomonadaceae bacterium]
MKRTLSPPCWETGSLLGECEGEIYLEDRCIGKVKVYAVDIDGMMNYGYSPWDLLDIDGATYPYTELLSEDMAGEFVPAVNRALRIDEAYSQNLLIIDRVEVLPKYRGRNFGLQAMHLILANLYPGCRIAAIKPFPLQFEGGIKDRPTEWDVRMKYNTFPKQQRLAKQKLRAHYAKLGFVPVRGMEFMVLDLEGGYFKKWDDVELGED